MAADYPVTAYLSIDQGLSNNSVRSIYQDHRGFMWFGTYDGLNRYDGYTFKVFRNNYKNPRSLINNWINAMDEDGAGNLWVGTRQGVCVYHGASNDFSSIYYASPQGAVNRIVSVIRDIERDREGNMLVGTADLGMIFVPKGDSVGIQVQLEGESMPAQMQDVAAIKMGAGKKMWVFVRGKGLCFYDGGSKKLRLVNATVTSANCLETRGGLLWIGANNGIYRYDIAANRFDQFYDEKNGLSSKDVVGLTIVKTGQLWVATNGGGITVLDLKTGASTYLRAGMKRYALSSNVIYVIGEDREARIWVGSLRGGINVIDQRKDLFQTIVSDPAATGNTLVSNYVFYFYEEDNGNLWIGTDGDGLSVWNRKTNQFTNYKHDGADAGSLSNDYISRIKADWQNRIWIVTYRGSVNRYAGAGRFEHYKFTDRRGTGEISNPLAYTLLEDRQKNIWVSTLTGGLFRLNRQTGAFELFDERLKDLFVLAEDRAGTMWGGNLSQLVQLDPVNRDHRSYLIGKPVRSIYEDRSHHFWIGTEGGGLVQFDRKQAKITARYTTDEGLCSNSVLNILEDRAGNLWMSTFNGISKFDVEKKTFTNYYQSDGLQSNQFNYNAALALKTGELVFGGIKGFTLFDPAHVSPKSGAPNIYFTALNVNNTPIEQESSLVTKWEGNDLKMIKVPYDKALFSAEFAALEYAAPDKVQYAYYLDGWDRTWNYIGSMRTATYTHLSEGTYLLRVKSTNADGVWGNKELRLSIIVLPPWYRSWWAWLTYAILAVCLVYSYARYRARQTRLKYEIRIANLNAENERAEKQRSVAEWEKEKSEREKREAELALEKAEKERGLAELAAEKAELEKERAEREREQAEREKERILREQEREINEKKITFFTNISHEFRTPLTLIINPIKDLLKKNQEEQTKPAGEWGTVYRNARRMLSLVDQLLLFRKAESGLDTIKPAKLNLYQLAWEVYLCFTQQAKTKNITYLFECANQDMEVYADREKLEIILYNLLSNALKYTPVDGKISFSVEELSEAFVVNVQDSGSGIPGETGEKLFDKFYKAERSITSSKPGFGIGLFLVKHFTEQHKGLIAYKSEEGQGAQFTLTLLKGKAHFGEETIVAEQESGPVFLEELKEEPSLEEITVEADLLPTADLVTEKQTILVVEDDEQIRHYLVKLFKEKYIVQQAENGDKGLKAAQKYLPDLLISDVHMQGMNGIELCKAVKENELLNHIPVILLTASTSDELKLKGVEGGADDYIIKPFDNSLLMARVTNLLKSRNNLQKYFYNEITLKKSDQRISPEYKAFIEKCISIVEAHLDTDNFSVKTLQEEMGMSHSNLFRKIKSVSGQSINVFIRFIRLRKAAELFINTSYNINEVAFTVGINDIKYFREQFNKLFGMNPSDYIRRYRKIHGKQYTVDKESINPEN
ncbi:MAG: response regulator [Williamsia sp.]|nr:response regulator [Williamsia sp.]